ncbi:MAG TPA: hypothetical protein PLZ12_10200 [Saprospiraceae bacterium]|nr:hypothetical protein [Saprospiraceae bacterium]
MKAQNNDCPPIREALRQQAKNSVEETILFRLFEQIRIPETNILMAGMMLTAKDMLEYLVAKSYDDNQAIRTFRSAWIAAVDSDRFYWEAFFPGVFVSLDDANMPSGMTQRVAGGETEEIGGYFEAPDLDREWSRYIGWSFFKAYSVALKDSVRAAFSLPGWQQATDSDSKILFMARHLLESVGGKRLYWALLMLIVSILLVVTHFSTLPESEP